jgi:nitroimidazol reductase NimA-like FMN-containing flavoprotein (pyridoxamine 5'-phosphate oxidase superfamily)
LEFPQTDRNRVQRIPARGQYDKATVYDILDAGFLCHVGFVVDGQPYVIPTLYGRQGDHIYLHGASSSRMLKTLAQGIDVCVTVTHVDALVLARSVFHHSMNYRSVVLFGSAQQVEGADKLPGLRAISNNVLAGRWEEARGPNSKELKATTVLRLEIDSASAKIRSGPPGDDEEDYALPIWAGILPLTQSFGPPEPDPRLAEGIPQPASLRRLLR